MTTKPDEIRDRIDETRSQLSDDVSQLADAVSPSQIAARQVDRVKDAVSDVKDKVMRRDDEPDSPWSAGRTGAAGTSRIGAAPRWVRSSTAGNPWAAGLVAVGIGWLVGSMLPASDAERAVAGKLTESATPMLAETASEVADHLREPARDAMESVRESASDAVETVRTEGRTGMQEAASQLPTSES